MIWVIGGTKDSRDFVEKFQQREKLIVTTATEYGRELLLEYKIKVSVGKMNTEEMQNFIKVNSITAVVDLSHPYAKEVSQNAKIAASHENIGYLRFERPNLDLEHTGKIFGDIEKLVSHVEELQGNILVTLGSNTIEKFAMVENKKNIYFRVLPTSEVIKKCENNGILPRNILAIQGPFSKEMNSVMLKDLNIKYLVTKFSGDTGGEREKIEACRENSVKIIFLSRPKVRDFNTFENIEELIGQLKS